QDRRPNTSTTTVKTSARLNANNKVYDRTTTATINSNSVSLSGVVSGDSGNVSLSTNGYTATFSSASMGTGKTVTLSGLTLTGSADRKNVVTRQSVSASSPTTT